MDNETSLSTDKLRVLCAIDKVEAKEFLDKAIPNELFIKEFTDSTLQLNALYRQWQPDVIIVNFEGQYKSVLQLVGTIRNLQKDQKTKIIVISAENKEEERALLVRWNIQKYFVKPVDGETLYRTIFQSFSDEELANRYFGVNKVKEGYVLNLVIAEDDDKVTLLYKKFLSPKLFSAIFVKDGQQALNIYERQKIDMLLLDIMMPNTKGVEVLKEIREKQGDSNTPIIMVTSQRKQEIIQECVHLSIQGYLIKPFQVATFNQMILEYYLMHHNRDKDSKPLFKEPSDFVVEPSETQQPVQDETKAKKSKIEKKIKILIAEDDKKVAVLYERFLSGELFEKNIVNDGNSAIATYDSFKPDILILDILMPEMTGKDVLKEIRETRNDNNIAIIMATSQRQEDTVKECIQYNIQGYIIKPFDIKTLNTKILQYYQNHIQNKIK